MQKKSGLISSKGLTLIELIVALSIFALVVPLATGLLVSIVQNQRNLLTQQDIMNQANYVTEYMGKALRTAIRSNDSTCLPEPDMNYELIDCGGISPSGSSGNGIKFINHTDNDSCQTFCLNAGGHLEEIKTKTVGGISTTYTNNLTPSNYYVSSFNVFISSDTQDLKYQPRVTFFVEMQGCDPRESPENLQTCKASNPPLIRVQTTVSQRNLNL